MTSKIAHIHPCLFKNGQIQIHAKLRADRIDGPGEADHFVLSSSVRRLLKVQRKNHGLSQVECAYLHPAVLVINCSMQ